MNVIKKIGDRVVIDGKTFEIDSVTSTFCSGQVVKKDGSLGHGRINLYFNVSGQLIDYHIYR